MHTPKVIIYPDYTFACNSRSYYLPFDVFITVDNNIWKVVAPNKVEPINVVNYKYFGKYVTSVYVSAFTQAVETTTFKQIIEVNRSMLNMLKKIRAEQEREPITIF